MSHAKQNIDGKVVHTWKEAEPFFELWRKNLSVIHVELKGPRVIDVLPNGRVAGEPADRAEQLNQKFRGHLIYFTSDDLTIRRPSGAILVIENYEIVAISAGKKRFEPK